jgi:dTDP-4-dehydrorhamnose 3,5-epimerase-like enzyme
VDPPGLFAVTGLYCYGADVFDVIAELEPSGRGELEITDVNNHYVRAGTLEFDVFEGYWGDAGESIDAYYEVIERVRRPHFTSDRLRPTPLRRFEDERGWLMEIARTSLLPKPIRQTNVSFSRQGTIRGLHYHERGQDDLFVCLQGKARVVALDRETGETFTEDIGDDNFAAVYVPGNLAHGFEALTDVLMLYHVTEEYDAADPDEHQLPWDDPRVAHLWSTTSPILSERDQTSES